LTQIDRECGPGTGPMMLPSDADGPTTWRQRQDLTLVRNPHHWRRLAEPGCWNIGGVRLLFRSGPSIFTAVLSGEIDWVMPASVDAVLGQHPELAEHYRKLAYDYETLGVVGILWNCRVPALQDVRVRRALAMLLDREAIVAGFPDTAVPAVAFAKPGTPAYPPGPSDADGIEPLPFDPPAARALLRDAGFDAAAGKPLALHVLATPDGGIMDLAVDLLRDACKQAGVELTVDTLTFAAYVAKKTSGDWDGILMKRSFRPWGDPFDFVHSGGLDNDGDWQNAEADRLATAARRELDEARRCALWHELHALVYREQPFAFLVHPRACILFNKFVENAEPGPRGLWPERWWVAPEHQRR
ncbi:MAG: hypothetical protein KDE27_11800, partial [Planctomycetes bacterium]|nr:hypothetical protein [Planctomycetota bacterium]